MYDGALSRIEDTCVSNINAIHSYATATQRNPLQPTATHCNKPLHQATQGTPDGVYDGVLACIAHTSSNAIRSYAIATRYNALQQT